MKLRLELQRRGLRRSELERLSGKSIVVFLGEGRETTSLEAGAPACSETRCVQVVPGVVPETEKPPGEREVRLRIPAAQAPVRR